MSNATKTSTETEAISGPWYADGISEKIAAPGGANLWIEVVDDGEHRYIRAYGLKEGSDGLKTLGETAHLIAAAPDQNNALKIVQKALANWRDGKTPHYTDEDGREYNLEEIKYCFVDPAIAKAERADHE